MDCLEGIKSIPKPDLIITDPPYEFENKSAGLYSLKRFNRQMKEIERIKTNTFDFYKYIPKILDLQGDKVNAYFFCNKKLIYDYLKIAEEKKLLYDVHVFRKKNPVPAFNNSFMNDLEYIMFLRSPNTYFSSGEGYKNYTKHYSENIGHHGLLHPNQKPEKLLEKYIGVSSKEGQTILDPFLGSGTTAIACKRLNRHFIGFEINREYCKIANKRLMNVPKRYQNETIGLVADVDSEKPVEAIAKLYDIIVKTNRTVTKLRELGGQLAIINSVDTYYVGSINYREREVIRYQHEIDVQKLRLKETTEKAGRLDIKKHIKRLESELSEETNELENLRIKEKRLTKHYQYIKTNFEKGILTEE